MKKILVFLLFFGFGLHSALGQASICAIVDHDGEALSDARVYVKSKLGIESFYLTDSMGISVINGLAPGIYSLLISNESKSLQAEFTEINLQPGSFLVESFSLTSDVGNRYVKGDSGWVFDVIEETDSAFELDKPLGAVPASAVLYDEVSYYSEREEVKESMVDAEVASMKKKSRAEESMSTIPEPEPVGEVPNESAGQLTASEWSDLQNWDLWADQIEEEFEEYSRVWSLAPKYRSSIHLKNKNGENLVHALIEVVDQTGKILARARTNNKGISELFFEEPLGINKKVRINYMGEIFTLNNKEITKDMVLELRTRCNNSNVVEIMFVVDATGSMGDEIKYLKAEVQDVISRISQLDAKKEVRSGAIFYRDHTDQYLSRRKELSTDVGALNTFIHEQTANGGGDFPEALDVALEELTTSINWSAEAITKIAFLILDAPPHEDSVSVQRINESVIRAAEQGIRLIPVTGSGINKSTEYLMKALSISTNGTYLYLTDDSGIGNKHLEASNDKSDVEFLNDLMVRVVQEMIELDCFEASNNQDIIVNDWNNTIGLNVYPNPVKDYLNIELAQAVDQVQIIDLQGKIVQDLGQLDMGSHQFDASSLKSGIYFVVFKNKSESFSLKLVCAR